ncbi:hypothetical protein FKP32DRAFT_1536412, partial [Trametes sanguinea]
QPCILLALIVTSALHTLSGVDGNAANLVLGMVRAVLTGAFIACNGRASPRPSKTLDSIPRDIRTVLSRLGLEPDVVRYATC